LTAILQETTVGNALEGNAAISSIPLQMQSADQGKIWFFDRVGGVSQYAILDLSDGSISPVSISIVNERYSLSPDGTQLMLLSGTTFYVLNASDGTVAYSFAVNGTVTYFDWSPLGNKVAYIGNQSGSSFRIYVIDDITIPTPVPRLVSQQCQPTSLAWSPDGTQIVFSRSVGGESVLNIVDANAN